METQTPYFVDISIPVKEIREENDEFIIDVRGLLYDPSGHIPDETIGAIFRIKKNLEPHIKFIIDEKGILISSEHIDTTKWEWKNEGSSLELLGPEGASFIHFLLAIFGGFGNLKNPDKIKPWVPFDVLMIYGDMKKIQPFKEQLSGKNDKVGLAVSSSYRIDYLEGAPAPKVLKFKLQHVLTLDPLVSFEFFLTLDLENRELIFSEKDIEMRPNFRKIFEYLETH